MIHEIVIGVFRFRAVPRFNRIDLLFILGRLSSGHPDVLEAIETILPVTN